MILYVGLFLGASCTSAPGKTGLPYTDFPETFSLQGTPVPVDTALFRYPFRIRVYQDVAVVLDLHGTDHFCHAFTYPDFRYLSSFGKRGEAPQELLSAENIRWAGGALWLLDSGRSELVRFSVSSPDGGVARQHSVRLDQELLRVLDFVQPDDTTLLVPDYSGESRFCQVNREGRLVCRCGAIPSSDADALRNARPALAQAWRSFLDYNPHNDVLAAVTQLGEVLEVSHLRDTTHVVRIGPHGDPDFQISQGYGIPVGIMGFSDVQVTDRAIYAVFHGRSFRQIAQSVQHGIRLPDGGRYIYSQT